MWMAAKQTLSLHQSPNPPQQAPLLLPVLLHCWECHLPHHLGSRHPAGPLFRPCPAEIQQQFFHPFGLILTILVSFLLRFHSLPQEIELFDALRTLATPRTLSLRISSVFNGCFRFSCTTPYRSNADCAFFISPGSPLFQVIVN